MSNWLVDNLGSIVAVIALVVIVAAIVIKIAYDKKHGKSNCGCDCRCCAMSEECNKKH